MTIRLIFGHLDAFLLSSGQEMFYSRMTLYRDF